jgi:hypothetical protein
VYTRAGSDILCTHVLAEISALLDISLDATDHLRGLIAAHSFRFDYFMLESDTELRSRASHM